MRAPILGVRAARLAACLSAGTLLLAAGTNGCTSASSRESPRIPPDPATPWTAPPEAKPPQEAAKPAVALPEEFLASKDSWTLEDIVDLALRNNPATRATWAAARAASAHVGSEQGAYFPQITGGFSYAKTKSSFSSQVSFEQESYAPSLVLHWVLFDFGKRGADIGEARQTLYAANWTHNATIQDVVLEVERSYYTYLYAKALRVADSLAVKEASANLDAAQARHGAGLATVADVLQAKSTLAQKRLALQTVEGQIQTVRGSLATAMGLPPTTDYDVGLLPSNLPIQEVGKTVDELITEAEAQRPDLAAARANALAAKSHVKSLKADRWPQISLDGTISRRYYSSLDDYSNNYSQGVFLTVPLFTGLSNHYDVVEAESKAEVAHQNMEILRAQVGLDVWSSYYDLKTAGERMTTTEEFLESATESHNVALERYQTGVGTILELLAAQASLEAARAQSLQARTDWLLALAQLAHATGRLGIAPPAAATTNEDGKR